MSWRDPNEPSEIHQEWFTAPDGTRRLSQAPPIPTSYGVMATHTWGHGSGGLHFAANGGAHTVFRTTN